jgi:hypothetical protein
MVQCKGGGCSQGKRKGYAGCGHIRLPSHSTGGLSLRKGGMPERRSCSGCGKEYWWPSARWQHENCVVVNAATNVVVNGRTKDRHRKTTERREYVKMKMREYRRKRAVRG